MNPEVAIVIVNWNKKDYVLNLLRSLEAIDYDNHEVIVVDNASTDNSVEAIKKTFPDVTLLVNKENLGGTGGFNTGMKYALHNTDCKYIWLLDNDAEVERHTLIELVKAMEADPDIGIAGSRIMSPEDRDLIVELGGYIDWNSTTWSPNLRYQNQKEYNGPNVVETDYVAACSALIRRETLEKTGLMDRRFFLHWDDIDLCLRARDHGYKIVSVFSSRVFHGVEKGFNPLALYYDFRNGLLIRSKRLKGTQRFISIFKLLRLGIESLLFFLMENKVSEAKSIFFSFTDFISNNFHKVKRRMQAGIHSRSKKYIEDAELKRMKKFLVFPEGTYNEVVNTILKIEQIAHAPDITLLIQDDRKNLFNHLPVRAFMTFNIFKESNLKKILFFAKLLKARYDVGVSTSESYSYPFAYCVKRHIVYEKKSDRFFISDKKISMLWKIGTIILLGDIIATVMFPIFYIVSFRYKEQ